MFGHQDNQNDQHLGDNGGLDPAPDGTLTADNDINPAMPPASNQPGASSVADTLASDDSTPAAPARPVTDDTGDTNGLLDIKQQALQQLSPLVDHLDQTPEEKFRTTMMMIQASDDQSLVKIAYDAAKQISDEKTKAQALLDIVNEINYFTHQSNNGE